MRKTIQFSINYHVFYVFGSMMSGTFTYQTKAGLMELKVKMIDHLRKDDTVEAIRFDDIWNTEATEMKGAEDVQFAKKVTNQYW